MAQVEPPQIAEAELELQGEILIGDYLEQRPDLKAKKISDETSELSKSVPLQFPAGGPNSLLDYHRYLEFEEAYKVTTSPRGRCLIINNRLFSDKKRLCERQGTDKDRDDLCRLFENLDYVVTRRDNRTADEIVSDCSMFILDGEFERFDSCVLCILSHGYNEKIYGSDSKTVKLETEILDLFNRPECKLKGKPKLVIIQACRIAMKKSLMRFCFDGNTFDTKDEGSEATETLDEIIKKMQELNVQNTLRLEAAVPNNTDILIAYSTLPGALSWIHESHGSWFIQTIVRVFNQRSGREHVADMMVMVKNIVNEAFSGIQIPNVVPLLRKKFYFFPAIHS